MADSGGIRGALLAPFRDNLTEALKDEYGTVAAVTAAIRSGGGGDTSELEAMVDALQSALDAIDARLAAVEGTAPPSDTTPNAFAFTAQANVLRSTVTQSNAITVSGINAGAAIGIVGGEYQIGSGSWTASPGTVADGQSVKVRLTSSSSYDTIATATLTVGGVPGVFSVKTEAAPETDEFSVRVATIKSEVPTGSRYAVMSTRNFDPTRTGPLLRLRRSTDSAVLDFGAVTGNTRLDVAAITTWRSGGTAFVQRFYDQIVEGRYVEQTTTTAQPTLVISGTDAWIVFASGKHLPFTSMLDFAQYRDSAAIGLIGQVPGTPDTSRVLVGVSRGIGANNSRSALIVDASNRIRIAASAFDDVGGYNGVGSEVPVGTAWFAGIGRADFRGGASTMKVGGVETTYPMTEYVKSDKALSAGGRLNGHSSDTGTAWNMHTVVFGASPQPNVAIPASTIWPVGDSQVGGTTIVAGSIYQPTATLADRPGPVLANKFESEAGAYRYVHAKGTAGATSTAIKNTFVSTVVSQMDADDVLYIQVGQNNAKTTEGERQVVLDDIAAMIAASPTTKIIIGTMSYWRTETPGTTAYINKKLVNDAIMATWPSYAWDMASMMATYGGNTDGRTPDALLWRADTGTYDQGHRGVLGTKVEYADGHDGQPGLFGVIQARGY